MGSRRVLAVVNVDSPDTLDQIQLDLPIMKEHGQHVQVDVTPLRRFLVPHNGESLQAEQPGWKGGALL